MHAIEFDSMSKDGFIYIPQEYKSEIDNKEKIRLVVMYDIPLGDNKNDSNDELQKLEKLFLNSNNEIQATREMITNTDEMCHDIS